MADVNGGPPLPARLKAAGYRFEFFQAVRLLERLRPTRQPVGLLEDPAKEVVRFSGRTSLAFPASEIDEIWIDDDGSAEMTVNFMTLVGPQGPLPRHWSLLATDPGVRAFLDLFTHRLVSLFFRAWEKYRFPIAFERDALAQAREAHESPTLEDRPHRRPGSAFDDYLFCLVGMGTEGLRGQLAIDDRILLFYAGLLSRRPRSAAALEGLLSDYFELPITVAQFQGESFSVPESDLASLGEGRCRLGDSALGEAQDDEVAVLWEELWDPQASFEVRVGPLDAPAFRDFLPTGDSYRHLVDLTRFFVGESFSFSVRPILGRQARADACLGDRGVLPRHEQPPLDLRLGWSSWLTTGPLDREGDEVVLGVRNAESVDGNLSWRI